MVSEIVQGPKVGTKWPSEMTSYTDPHTGARVRRLTGLSGTQNRHLYFTTNGWYDDGRQLLLRCHREGERNLFSINLETGLLTQLTDLPGGVHGATRLNPRTNEVYFGYSPGDDPDTDTVILGLNVDTLIIRTIAEQPEEYKENYNFGVDDVLADNEHLLVSVSEHTQTDGHESRRAEYPHCAIFTVPIDDDEPPELVHEEEYWISHVNASPTRPELFTYCHEGPWDNVDNRIHLVNLETDANYKLRPMGENEAVGHEYWLADGEYVGYHGWEGERTVEDCFHGTIRYDNTDCRETPIPVRRTHCHAISRKRFVCDGDDTKVSHILLFEYDEDSGEYHGPRKLATHAWDSDSPHPHSRMSPCGSVVAFDGDPGGARDVFLVDVPETFEDLPEYEDPTKIDLR